MSPSTAPAAVTAFLRGCERRARLFLHWFGCDAPAAEAIQARTADSFALAADQTPVRDWQQLYWRHLLGSAGLRAVADDVAIPGLGRLGRGPRAAVLLRLVAGLDDEVAAQVLGIASGTYRMALRHGLPRLHDGRLDEETWRVLQQRVQQQLQQDATGSGPLHAAAGPQRLPAHPQRRRPHSTPGDPAARPARWRLPAMLAIMLLTALALTATFFIAEPQPAHLSPTEGRLLEAEIQLEPLRGLADAGGRYDEAFALATEPDLELLLDAPPPQRLHALAFDAWHAAELAEPQPDMPAIEPLPEAEESLDEHP